MSRVSPYPIFRSDSKEEISLLKIGSRTILDPHVIEVFSQQRSDKTSDCILRPGVTAGLEKVLFTRDRKSTRLNSSHPV